VRYRVTLTPAALRQIKKLDPQIRKSIVLDLERLAGNPRPVGFEKLATEDKLYRIRVGPGKDYRAIYQVRDRELLVLVLKVGDRKDVYRHLH
jgi:mRNA interferase RelE/StbE